MEKKIGRDFLHTHPMMENKLNINAGHCIVDTKDVEEIINFFNDNPCLAQWIGKGCIHWNANTNKPFDVVEN
jgi:hypothetical protein